MSQERPALSQAVSPGSCNQRGSDGARCRRRPVAGSYWMHPALAVESEASTSTAPAVLVRWCGQKHFSRWVVGRRAGATGSVSAASADRIVRHRAVGNDRQHRFFRQLIRRRLHRPCPPGIIGLAGLTKRATPKSPFRNPPASQPHDRRLDSLATTHAHAAR
jgi:hypothetical protein